MHTRNSFKQSPAKDVLNQAIKPSINRPIDDFLQRHKKSCANSRKITGTDAGTSRWMMPKRYRQAARFPIIAEAVDIVRLP